MKTQKAKDALRKLRKSTKKSLMDVDDQELVQRFQNSLANENLKKLFIIYDQLSRSKPEPVQDEYQLNAEVEPSLPNGNEQIPHPHLVMAVDVAQKLSSDLYPLAEVMDGAVELIELLSSAHMRSLLDVYDTVTQERYYPALPPLGMDGNYGSGTLRPGQSVNTLSDGRLTGTSYLPLGASRGALSLPGSEPGTQLDTVAMEPSMGTFPAMGPSIKMVGIKKEPGEELGITVSKHQYHDGQGTITEIVVERILHGSRIDRQGLLHPGDVIREVNGVAIESPEALQKLIRESQGTITLKVIPAFREKPQDVLLFLRAHFSYDPRYDQVIPSQEAGLEFQVGDILQILDQSDPNWWQARHFGSEARAGLIPSWTLQERRRAFMQSTRDPDEVRYKMFGRLGVSKRHKTVKTHFCANDASNWDRSDVVVYEEVARIPGFQRKVICLIGAPGIGRRTLKNMLLRSQPDRYAVALPHTSRPIRPNEVSGEHYYFTSRPEMEADIRQGTYIEVGEFANHLYGTKMDTIRAVCRAGRTCLMDCSIQALRGPLRTAEFMPYVVFLASPSVDCQKAMYEYGRSMQFTDKYKRDEDFRRTMEESMEMERKYRHLFDYTIVNDNMDVTFEILQEHLDSLLTDPQWVPIKWVY